MQECYTDIHSIINGNLIWTGDKTNFKKKTPSTDHRPHHTDHTRTMRTRTPRRSTVQIFKMPANQASAGNSNCTVSIIKNANTMRLLHISAPPLEKYTVRSLFVGGLAPFGIIRKISKSQLRSVSALRAKTVRKPHGLETTRARYSFLNFGSVPSCALFGLVLVFWHRFDGSWCYCGLLGFHAA